MTKGKLVEKLIKILLKRFNRIFLLFINKSNKIIQQDLSLTDSPSIATEHNLAVPSISREKKKFCILSVGGGSIWLSGALHYHPEIACSAGFDHTLMGSHYEFNSNEFENNLVKTLDPRYVKYGTYKLVNDEHLAGHITTKNYKEYMHPVGYPADELIKELYRETKTNHIIPDRISKSELDKLYNELNDFYPAKKVLGNVHGLYCQDYNNLTNSSKKDVIFIDLIRHPVSRLENFVNIFVKLCSYNSITTRTIEDFYNMNQDLANLYVTEFNIDFNDIKNKARFYANCGFLDGCSSLFANDIRSLDMPRILFERLRNDPSYFRWVVSYLTNGYIVPDKDYVDHVYTEHYNLGRQSKKTKTYTRSKDQWDDWSEWQQYMFKEQCEKYSLKELYNQFGYDLSYVK